MKFHFELLMLPLLIGCGVEVGNPGKKGGSGTTTATGSIDISFAKEAVVASERLSLNLSGFDLLTGDDNSIVSSLSAKSSQVELMGLADDQSSTSIVAESSTIPVGVYDRILVRLLSDEPIQYRDRSGGSRTIKFDDAPNHAFYVDHPFEITEGQTTSVAISIDPYRSILTSPDSQDITFKPRGGARRNERGQDYKGTTTTTDAEWVCAYAYNLGPMPHPGSDRRRELPKLGTKGPTGPSVENRKDFAGKDSIVFDTSNACENAFAKVPVASGRYELRHLPPGSYALRIFKSDGSYIDDETDIDLKPHLRHP
jgi:hypothetical protein